MGVILAILLVIFINVKITPFQKGQTWWTILLITKLGRKRRIKMNGVTASSVLLKSGLESIPHSFCSLTKGSFDIIKTTKGITDIT